MSNSFNSTLPHSTSNVSQSDAANNSSPFNQDLRNELRRREAELISLRRSIPYLKDLNGDDVTEKMLKLSEDLAKEAEMREHWENKYAESEQKFADFKHAMEEEISQIEQERDDIKRRAQQLEIENEELRIQVDDAESFRFNAQNSNSNHQDEEEEELEEDQDQIEHQDEEEREDHEEQNSTRDLLNISHDFISLRKRLRISYKTNKSLFEKLRRTADFLNVVLELINNGDEEGRELLKQINEISFELGKSLNETTLVNKEVQRTEESLQNFYKMVEKSFDLNISNKSPEMDVIIQSLKKSLEEHKDVISQLRSDNEELLKNNNELSLAYEQIKKQISAEPKQSSVNINGNEGKSPESSNIQDREEYKNLISQLQSDNEELLKSNNELSSALEHMKKQLTESQHRLNFSNETLRAAKEMIEYIETEKGEIALKCQKYSQQAQDFKQQALDFKEETVKMMYRIEELTEKLSRRDHTISTLEKSKRKISEKYENLKSHALKAESILEESNKILHERIAEGVQANSKEGGKVASNITNSVKPTKKSHEKKALS